MTPHWHAGAVAPKDWPEGDLGALFSRCSAGDGRARETITLRFLPLARRLARQYEGRGEPIEDLYQVASVGLIKAIDRFDPDRGDAFPAYARPVILGEIRRHFRDTTWHVHVPRPMRELVGRVLSADKELTSAYQSPATADAIARHLGLGPGDVAEARRALQAYRPGSLDATYVSRDGDQIALREAIGAHEPEYERVEMSVGVGTALLELKPRDQKVLLMRLAFDLTQDEIAGRIGVSQMHVSRIIRNAGAVLTSCCGLAVSA
jgi:RNA polymerase sigma-B factor